MNEDDPKKIRIALDWSGSMYGSRMNYVALATAYALTSKGHSVEMALCQNGRTITPTDVAAFLNTEPEGPDANKSALAFFGQDLTADLYVFITDDTVYPATSEREQHPAISNKLLFCAPIGFPDKDWNDTILGTPAIVETISMGDGIDFKQAIWELRDAILQALDTLAPKENKANRFAEFALLFAQKCVALRVADSRAQKLLLYGRVRMWAQGYVQLLAAEYKQDFPHIMQALNLALVAAVSGSDVVMNEKLTQLSLLISKNFSTGESNV